MLRKLTLTNFRQHRNLVLEFTYGLNAVRGNSEAGKTTLIEALAYALFGSRSLRNSADDTVTWGEAVRTMRVDAEVEFSGEVYTFSRTKGGAEVTKDGQVYVTGQTEVTNFAARLMGADASTASNLMMASQNNLRGALEQGPKATSELVEGLAEFDFFDHLLERMQERLVLGSDVSARQRLEDAQEKLDSLNAERPDTTDWGRFLEKAPSVIGDLQKLVTDKLQPAHDAAKSALEQAKSKRSTYDLLKNNLTKVQGHLDNARTQHIAASDRASRTVDTSSIKALQAELDNAAELAEVRRVYADMGKLNDKYPEAYWEGDAASLQEEISKTENGIETCGTELADLEGKVTTLRLEAKTLESQIQKDENCRACGQLLQNHEEIAAKNLKLTEQLDANSTAAAMHLPSIGGLKSQVESLKSELADLKLVFGSASPFDTFIRNNAQYLDINEKFVPAKISWKGRTPSAESVSVSEIKQQISDIEEAAKVVSTAAARAEALTQTISDHEAQLAEMQAQLDGFEVVNLSAFNEASNTAQQELFTVQSQISRVDEEMREAKHQIALANQTFEQQKAVVAEMQERVQACKKEIEDLGFNNALLRKVRASRGPVTDKLWNMVLAAVSTMFSQMRGAESQVTKDKDGFKVNGEEVTSLSGSTLDLLGLAIRCALTKTFLPSVSFLSLDEPAAACSEDRTAKMLGFLQTTGFAQTLLITHEDVSETIADNLITL